MGPGAARLTAGELVKLQPGFAAYFRSFIDQHLDQAAAERGDEALCDCILAVLTAAPSPIRHADLAVLVGMALGDARPITARSLAPLRRFILGDGLADGYVLQHARLATYLRGEYFKGGGALERVERAALSWCATVTAALASGEMAASDTPEFVLRNHPRVPIVRCRYDAEGAR